MKMLNIEDDIHLQNESKVRRLDDDDQPARSKVTLKAVSSKYLMILDIHRHKNQTVWLIAHLISHNRIMNN